MLSKPFFPDLKIALRLAMRARFLSFSVWLSLIVLVAALLGAQFSGRQPATVALDVGLSVIRLALPVLGVLLLQELLSREFDRRLFLTSLTYPRARQQFLLGRIAAVATLLLALLLIVAALLAGVTEWVARTYPQTTPPSLGLPYVVTIAFVALDLFVVLALGTLLGVVASTPSFVLVGTLGFMIVARSFSAIVALLASDSTLVGNAQAYGSSLNLLGYVVPDLATLDVRMIALYGQWQFLPGDWALRVTAALAYVVALLALAAWALNRKRFA